MSFLLHLVVSWWGVSDVGVAIIVTNVRGWRRRHLVLGHVALALARVSRLKLKRFPLRQALGNMRGWTVCNQIVYTPANGYEFLKFVSVSCIFRDS